MEVWNFHCLPSSFRETSSRWYIVVAAIGIRHLHSQTRKQPLKRGLPENSIGYSLFCTVQAEIHWPLNIDCNCKRQTMRPRCWQVEGAQLQLLLYFSCCTMPRLGFTLDNFKSCLNTVSLFISVKWDVPIPEQTSTDCRCRAFIHSCCLMINTRDEAVGLWHWRFDKFFMDKTHTWADFTRSLCVALSKEKKQWHQICGNRGRNKRSIDTTKKNATNRFSSWFQNGFFLSKFQSISLKRWGDFTTKAI